MTRSRRISEALTALVLVLTSLAVAPATHPGLTGGSVAASREAQRWVVELEQPVGRRAASVGMPPAAAEVVAATPGADVVTALDRLPFALVEADAATAAALAATPGVASVEPSVTYRAFAARPNDPFVDEQWNLPVIQTFDVWPRTIGSGVTVAVLDTGVARDLSDLASTRILQGVDLVENDGNPDDDNGHGSHLVGTIAQSTGNGIGVAGVAHGATILPVKVLDARGIGSDVAIAAGITYAADNGAKVINLSLGGPDEANVITSAVNYARNRGVIIVAATGNESSTTVSFPARSAGVIAVGAITQTLKLAPYSNRGPGVDLVAPGGVLSVDSDGDGYGDGILQQTIMPELERKPCYCFYEGTSMAAPHVAAAVALLLSAGVPSAQVEGLLTATARDLGPVGKDTSFGAGLVQIADALARFDAGATASSPPSAPEPAPAPAPQPAPGPGDGPIVYGPGESRDIDDACPPGEVPPAGYSDVSEGSVHLRAIDCVTARGVANGTSESTFGPAAGVTRAQLASFLARLIEDQGGTLPASPPDAFTDDDRSVHELRIDQLAAVGIVKGRTDRLYEPGLLVTRGQLASFLVATITYLVEDLPAPTRDNFDDDTGSTHEHNIDIVAERGITSGVGLRRFDPGRTLTREQMASFLARTIDLVVERSR